MLNEKTVEKLNMLLDKMTKGPLAGGGDLQRQIFISTVDQILSEEKSEYQRKIITLQEELLVISESAKKMQEIIHSQINPDYTNISLYLKNEDSDSRNPLVSSPDVILQS
jgi:hypothetical protein